MRYLDPKNDLVFKRVFGEHPNITISFLNALLPLTEGDFIEEIEYLPAELVPDLPGIMKNSIVDVRCRDNKGRQFIVEMQMLWTDSFKSRVLFNASKAYVRQLDKKAQYITLQPVYALSIVNEIFDHAKPTWYHHYKMVHVEDQNNIINGLQLIFVELPKFKPKNYTDKKLIFLWLRYLAEIENNKEMYDEKLLEELMEVPEIAQALELSKESAYSKEELEAYDKYWDIIRVEKTLIADAEIRGIEIGTKLGIERGLEQGVARGLEQGIERGIDKKNIEVILNSNQLGISISVIAEITNLSLEEVSKILREHDKA